MSTKIKPLNKCPTSPAWAEELQRESVAPQWLAHLEQCSTCQRVLDDLAASPQLWFEAQETLADRAVDLSHITESIVPLAAEPIRRDLKDPMCEFELAQLQRLLPARNGAGQGGGGSVNSYPPCEAIARIDRYDLEQLIGRGGMGLVFRAWDTQLHRVVAVKTLGMALWSMPAARERFIREGRAAAMLNHPNIVPMYDVINDPPVPALVMQYIAGPTLEEWIQSRGPLGWSHAVRIALQLADSLCAAHAEGLVHRDIKPGNVLLEADGTRALLTDFGLVRAMDDATLTQSGLLAGTPHFMSPEQARGEDVDGRSDLFSLGSLIYYAISGQTPFRGRESMSVLNSLCHAPHTPLCQINKEVPIEVSRLVDRLLHKQPSHRPASSMEVRDALRQLLASEHRLKPKRVHRPVNKYIVFMAAAALVAGLAFMVPHWSVGVRPLNLRAYGSGVTIESDADSMMESEEGSMTGGLTGIDSSLPQPVSDQPQIYIAPPDASELDALAKETDLVDRELSAYSLSLETRVGHGESISQSLWQATQELEQVQVGLKIPASETKEE